MSAEAGFDPAALARLDKLGGGAFVVEMIDIFFGYVPTRLAAAQAALAAGDVAGIEQAVHPLKASSGHVGAIRVHELAKQIEHLAQERHGESLPTALQQLEAAYLEVKPFLEAARAARA